MEEKFFETLAEQRVDLLLVGRGAERDRRERLGLAAGEDRGAVSAGQHLDLGAELADVGGFAIVDSLVVVEDGHPDPGPDQVVDRIDDFRGALGELLRKLGDDLVAKLVESRGALLFAFDCERFFYPVADIFFNRCKQRGVAFLGLEFAFGFARTAAQFFLHRKDRLHRFMRGEERFENCLFIDDVRSAFEHHDRLGIGCDHQRYVAAFEIGMSRIDDDFAVHPAHPDACDRATVGDVGDSERRRRRYQREHVGIVVAIGGEDGDDNLSFAVVALGEQRAHRAIDQSRSQNFLFGSAPFTLEKAAGDFAGGESLFDVVYRERQKVHVGAGLILRDRSREHDGIAIAGEHTAMRLPREPAGFERELTSREINFEFLVHCDGYLRED